MQHMAVGRHASAKLRQRAQGYFRSLASLQPTYVSQTEIEPVTVCLFRVASRSLRWEDGGLIKHLNVNGKGLYKLTSLCSLTTIQTFYYTHVYNAL